MENDIEKTFRTENNSIVAVGTIIKVDEKVTLEDWKSFGQILKKADNKVQWYLGFWWNYGHKKWSRDAEDFIRNLGYTRSTLQKYGQICNAIKPGTRVPLLSFRHHRQVAFLSDEKQEYYLKKAKIEELSSNKLREIIRQAERPSEPKAAEKIHRLTSNRHKEIMDKINEIARLLNVTMSAHVPVTLLKQKVNELKDYVSNINPN